jgi:MATE family multidrug resistance protein
MSSPRRDGRGAVDDLTASLLHKGDGGEAVFVVVVVPPVAEEEEPPPVLTCKPPGRFARAVKEAWSVPFPMMPSMSAGAAGAEARSILGLALPMILTGLLLYLRSMISMLFLGRLGGLALAGGSLAIGFANITGY